MSAAVGRWACLVIATIDVFWLVWPDVCVGFIGSLSSQRPLHTHTHTRVPCTTPINRQQRELLEVQAGRLSAELTAARAAAADARGQLEAAEAGAHQRLAAVHAAQAQARTGLRACFVVDGSRRPSPTMHVHARAPSPCCLIHTQTACCRLPVMPLLRFKRPRSSCQRRKLRQQQPAPRATTPWQQRLQPSSSWRWHVPTQRARQLRLLRSRRPPRQRWWRASSSWPQSSGALSPH